jgi:alpha-1,6-mannosyltransferase
VGGRGALPQFPETALVAAYCTDFPTVYVDRVVGKFLGPSVGAAAARISYAYAAKLYRNFDAVFAMSENGGAAKLRALGVGRVDVVPLGVELGEFSPAKRSAALRQAIGIADDEPLIIYAGRLDSEKRPQVVAEAFPPTAAGNARFLVLIGDGPMRESLAEQLAGKRALLPGFINDRSLLAEWLASADLYASGMANETFGISVIEAQASGLPVIGVAGGAMVDRVTPEIGRIGPVDDAEAMARNLAEVWAGDPRGMGEASWRHAQQFSWRQSMQVLFGRFIRVHSTQLPSARGSRMAGGGRTSARGVRRGPDPLARRP